MNPNRHPCIESATTFIARLVCRPLRMLMVTALIGSASATPINSATVGAGGAAFCTSEGGGSSSATMSAKIVCGDNTGSAAATALAIVGHVGATAKTSEGSLCCATNADANASYVDSVIFSGPSTGLIPVSMNLMFEGILNSTNEASAGVKALATIGGVLAGSLVANSSNGIGFSCTSTFAGVICGSQFTLGTIQTAIVMVAPNVPIDVFLSIEALSASSGAGTSSTSEFSNSLDFPIGSDLFNLPAGYTANSATSFIVDNHFMPTTLAVPEPDVAVLFSVGLFALGAVVRRRAM